MFYYNKKQFFKHSPYFSVTIHQQGWRGCDSKLWLLQCPAVSRTHFLCFTVCGGYFKLSEVCYRKRVLRNQLKYEIANLSQRALNRMYLSVWGFFLCSQTLHALPQTCTWQCRWKLHLDTEQNPGEYQHSTLDLFQLHGCSYLNWVRGKLLTKSAFSFSFSARWPLRPVRLVYVCHWGVRSVVVWFVKKLCSLIYRKLPFVGLFDMNLEIRETGSEYRHIFEGIQDES